MKPLLVGLFGLHDIAGGGLLRVQGLGSYNGAVKGQRVE